MSDNTFVTSDPKTVQAACDAMRQGKRCDWLIGSEPIRGEVVSIRALEGDEFRITVRE